MTTHRSRFDRGAVLLVVLFLLASAGCQTLPGTLPAAGPTANHVQIGYGSVAPRHLAFAVGSIRVDPSAMGSYTHVEEMLEGRLPGVDVLRTGSGFRVRVRGTSSILAQSGPLWVVDGLPLSNVDGYLGLSPRTVARIDVLKDAGAAAIYGSRGANGVILITTHRAM